MEERNDMDKIDDVLMPGFRFHPTDEELVDFYLKRKVQQKSLPIELIKQVDIYKYDPWDLPKMASSREKEWYFYCPRDRKYRNSARPNRVTRIGFWKATGTDRPIYSSEGKCIGLKKSLVFYKGRASKGEKTDWMMHEFRLPCIPDLGTPKKLSDKSLPASDSWAICRIFMKTKSMSTAQKAVSQPWFSHLPGSMISDTLTQGANCNQLSSENISCTTEIGSSSIQFCSNNKQQELNQAAVSNANTNFSASDNIPSYTVSKFSQIPVSDGDFADSFNFYNLEATFPTTKYTVDATNSMISNLDHCTGFEEPNQQYNSGFLISLPQDMQANMQTGQVQLHQWETGRTIGFPFNLSPNDAWKPTFPWDSHPCPSEMHTTYSTNKCYT